jgi:hypothetical protein
MLVLPPSRRRIPASHSRASLCSIGAGFMELVISRGTFNSSTDSTWAIPFNIGTPLLGGLDILWGEGVFTLKFPRG